MKGKGSNLPLPSLPVTQNPAVVMPVNNDNGVCWTSAFTAPATKNLASKFTDKTD